MDAVEKHWLCLTQKYGPFYWYLRINFEFYMRNFYVRCSNKKIYLRLLTFVNGCYNKKLSWMSKSYRQSNRKQNQVSVQNCSFSLISDFLFFVCFSNFNLEPIKKLSEKLNKEIQDIQQFQIQQIPSLWNQALLLPNTILHFLLCKYTSPFCFCVCVKCCFINTWYYFVLCVCVWWQEGRRALQQFFEPMCAVMNSGFTTRGQ